MKSPAIIIALAAILTGCARFSTVQTDHRTDYHPDGTVASETIITTKARASTFATAKSDLANWKAQQSEGEQGAEVGSLSQESSGTNAAATLQALTSLLNAVK